jgi:hypothetical protein
VCVGPGTSQLQPAAFPGLQLGVILLDQSRQLCDAERRQPHPRIEHTFTLGVPTDTFRSRDSQHSPHASGSCLAQDHLLGALDRLDSLPAT